MTNPSSTMPTSITVQLDWTRLLASHIGYDRDGEPVQEPTTPEDLIVMAVARQIADDIKRSHDDYYSSIIREVREMRETVIREHVTAEVEKALAGSVQRTNSYGESVGQPTTLREMVMAEVQTCLTKRNGGGFRDSGMTILEETVQTVTETTFRKELAEELAKTKASLSRIITDRAAKVLGDALVEATADNSLTAKTAVAVTR